MNKYPYYHGQLIITQNDSKYKELFHPKTIFKTLTNEHLLQILFLQKIKIISNNPTKINIYLDNMNIDDFNLNEKLKFIIKNCSDKFSIYFISAEDLDDKEVTQYKNFINDYDKV